jgi:hypothetical protein
MSDRRYCVIRDLGLVKGGKGMKHHEVLLTLAPKGLSAALVRLAKVLTIDSRSKFAETRESHH